MDAKMDIMYGMDKIEQSSKKTKFNWGRTDVLVSDNNRIDVVCFTILQFNLLIVLFCLAIFVISRIR